VHNVIAYIWNSTAYYNYFIAKALQAIPIDNDIRWNSWYNIILVALKLKDVIVKYQEQYIKEFNEENILNAADWRALKNIRDFL